MWNDTRFFCLCLLNVNASVYNMLHNDDQTPCCTETSMVCHKGFPYFIILFYYYWLTAERRMLAYTFMLYWILLCLRMPVFAHLLCMFLWFMQICTRISFQFIRSGPGYAEKESDTIYRGGVPGKNWKESKNFSKILYFHFLTALNFYFHASIERAGGKTGKST